MLMWLSGVKLKPIRLLARRQAPKNKQANKEAQ
jgi:hypothetical protein